MYDHYTIKQRCWKQLYTHFNSCPAVGSPQPALDRAGGRSDDFRETVEARRAAIYGWVYSPYRMNDLMQGILGGRNTGIGIEAAEQVKLILAFSRIQSPLSAKVMGTGLGLYLTKKNIVEILHVALSVTSDPGRGAPLLSPSQAGLKVNRRKER